MRSLRPQAPPSATKTSTPIDMEPAMDRANGAAALHAGLLAGLVLIGKYFPSW